MQCSSSLKQEHLCFDFYIQLRLHAANKEPAWNRVEEIMSDKLGKSTNKEDPQALKFWRVEKFQVNNLFPVSS